MNLKIVGGNVQDCSCTVPHMNTAPLPAWFEEFRSQNIPSKYKKLVNVFSKSKYLYDDRKPSTYKYYVTMINDTLTQIRRGQAAIVFHDYQIKELLRFEPELEMCEFEDLFYVWLPKQQADL